MSSSVAPDAAVQPDELEVLLIATLLLEAGVLPGADDALDTEELDAEPGSPELWVELVLLDELSEGRVPMAMPPQPESAMEAIDATRLTMELRNFITHSTAKGNSQNLLAVGQHTG